MPSLRTLLRRLFSSCLGGSVSFYGGEAGPQLINLCLIESLLRPDGPGCALGGQLWYRNCFSVFAPRVDESVAGLSLLDL